MLELRKIIADSFYTLPLMVFCAFIAFILGLINRSKFRETRFLIYYPFTSILQVLSVYYSVFADPNKEEKFENLTGSIFIIVEFIIFSKFFYTVLIIKKLRSYLLAIFITFLLYILYLWIYRKTFYNQPYQMYLPQTLCILTYCFLYFFQIFKLPPKLNLLKNPSFWITIGCLFYFSCTIPLFFANAILDVFPHYDNFYSINYLAYSILFLLIAKSFLCKQQSIK